jgi:hypothetical protein
MDLGQYEGVSLEKMIVSKGECPLCHRNKKLVFGICEDCLEKHYKIVDLNQA